MENSMSSKEVIDRAYGSVPRELPGQFSLDLPPLRGLRYYFLKFLRKFTRRK
jgi:hypothetical protein